MAEPTSMTPGATAVLTLSTAVATSSAIGNPNSAQTNGTTTCRIATTIDAWLVIGSSPVPVANTTGFLLPGGTVEYFDVPFGQKVGAIAAGAGYLSITQMSKV